MRGKFEESEKRPAGILHQVQDTFPAAWLAVTPPSPLHAPCPFPPPWKSVKAAPQIFQWVSLKTRTFLPPPFLLELWTEHRLLPLLGKCSTSKKNPNIFLYNVNMVRTNFSKFTTKILISSVVAIMTFVVLFYLFIGSLWISHHTLQSHSSSLPSYLPSTLATLSLSKKKILLWKL